MMKDQEALQKIKAELGAAIQLPKCQKCGCMRETVDSLAAMLPSIGTDEADILAQDVAMWSSQMQPVRYACLGCEHCYPAVAQNAVAQAFPSVEVSSLQCEFQVSEEQWPPVVGGYIVLDHAAPVAVSTLASLDLLEALAAQKPAGLAIVGKTETENIGLDKIIKNVITNPALRVLLVCGRESEGHQSGRTLLALVENGVDSRGRVIGSPGKRPILRNVSPAEIEAFRDQVQVIDLIGCEEPEAIAVRISELAESAVASCGCCHCTESRPSVSTTPLVRAGEPDETVTMDKAGYFVIVPVAEKGLINVEHYGYDNTLLRIIEGETARALYKTITANGWVSELSHAAYLGRELTKAELSLEFGFKYVQDGA